MKLRTKFLLIFVLVTAVTMLAVSVLGYIYARQQVVKSTIATLNSTIEGRATHFNGWLSGKAKMLETVNRTIQHHLGDLDATYLYSFKSDGDVTDMYIGLQDGRFIDGAGAVLPPDFDPRKRGWYKDAVNKGGLLFTEPYVDVNTKKYVVSAAVPVKNEAGQIHGVLGEDILLSTITGELKDMNLNGEGYAFLIDGKGNILGHPDEKLLGSNILENADMKDVIKQVLTNDQGNMTYTVDGIEKILVYQKIAATGWVLGINVPSAIIGKQLNSLLLQFLLVYIVILLLVGAFAIWFAQRLTIPLVGLAKTAEQLAAGDLTAQIAVTGQDEVGQLAGSFNKMSYNLRALIEHIRHSAQMVGTVAQSMQTSAEAAGQVTEQIAVTITELAQGSTSQTQSINHGAGMVEDMSKSINTIASDINSSALTAADVQAIVEAGYQAVANQTGLMDRNRQAAENVSTAIHNLAEKSDQIGQIVDAIASISGQTNLLALNAAIEAARAGEHGRGFAVVAEEVRKLAEQAEASTREISSLITDIQASTSQAVKEMNIAEQLVGQQQEAVAQTGQFFTKIQQAAGVITTQIQHVASETQVVNQNTSQVSGVIADIVATSEQSAAATQEVAAATQEQTASVQSISQQARELAQEADLLKVEIAKFKI